MTFCSFGGYGINLVLTQQVLAQEMEPDIFLFLEK